MSRLRDLSISTKFLLVFGLLFLLCAGQGVASLLGFTRLNRALKILVDDTAPSVQVSGEIRYAVSTIRRTDLLLVVCATADCREHYREKRNKYLAIYKNELEAAALLISDQQDRDLMAQARVSLDAYIAISERARTLAESGNSAGAVALLLSPEAQGAYNTGVDLAEKDAMLNQDEGASEGKAAQATSSRMVLLMRGILLVTLALCVLVGYAASRMIAEPLKVVTEALERVAARDLTASVEVTSSDEFGRLSNALNTSVAAMREVLQLMRQGSGTVTAAARELSDHAHRNKDNSEAQTGKINQIATAAHQVTQTISEISLNIESAATASQESADAAEKGNLVMQSAAQTMGKIAEVTSAVHEKISSLVDRSREIGEVAQMIQEISEQTHMLAFNAAIEAARGGEHGTGFVVVANHVRHLAESTKTATGEIAATISGIQRETNDTLEAIASSRSTVEAGLSETAEARESLETVITSSRDLGKKIYVIRTAATEQTAASAEISESARNIAQLANENSHATNDGAKAANRLSDLAHQLDGIIGQFKISSNQVAAAH